MSEQTLVHIDGLAVGGATIGTIVSGDETQIGKKAFVPFAAPGETVVINIIKDAQGFVEGDLVSIRTRSPDRIEPPCPYFTQCGGCNFQHLKINDQRNGKRILVEETLLRQGGVSPVNGVHLSSHGLPPYGYRRKVSMHVTRDGKTGFHQPKSHRVIEVDKCLIASGAINNVLPEVQKTLQPYGKLVQAVVIEEKGDRMKVIFHPRQRKIRHELRALIQEIRKDVSFDLSMAGDKDNASDASGHFFQVNDVGNKILHDIVINFCNDSGEKELTELFAGGGNFSFPLAMAGFTVHAVEADKVLVNFGRTRAKELGVALDFSCAPCEDFIKDAKFSPLVLLDPPRCGAKEVCEAIIKQDVKAIVYVSCSLATLCRDLKILKEGGFEVQEVRVVDMFSQTHHIETVSYLVRK